MSDGGDRRGGGDGGGHGLATAAAAVRANRQRLTEADCQRCLTEVTEVAEVTEMTAAVTVCALPLLLSVSVETDWLRLTGRGV